MRKIKDAIDLNTGEKVYFRGHAQSTYMSDGRTVEQAIKSGGGSGGGSYDDTEIQNKLTELSAEKEDKANKVTNLTDESTDTQYPSAKAVYALKERISENEVLIEDLQNTKIDKEADDYYPQLSVGVADNLAGVDVVDSEVNFRRSGGGAISDGVARIESIKGNSVVWNQKIQRTYKTTTHNGITYSVNDDGSVVANGTASEFSYCSVLRYSVFVSRKYCVIGGADNSSSGTYYFGDGNNLNVIDDRIKIANPLKDATVTFACRVHKGVTVENVKFAPPILIDLTQMFGAGNEPTTIEEFYARIPMGVDLNAYNEGEVIHMNVQSIESQGVNAWDEEWENGSISSSTGQNVVYSDAIRNKGYIKVIPQKYFVKSPKNTIYVFGYDKDYNYIGLIKVNNSSNVGNQEIVIENNVSYIRFYLGGNGSYNHDICINISDTSINGKYYPYIKRVEDLAVIRKYFPQGMKSAGSAHDEIRYNKASGKWEKVVRIGEVDLGTLTWYYYADYGFYAPLTNEAMWHTANFLSALPYDKKVTPSSGELKQLDKVMMLGAPNIGDSWAKKVVIKDSAYTDTATFKAAMAGVILYYELAEPIITELDEADQFKDLDYQVWNCGTEKAIAEGKSAPLAADITYGFNAIGKIKELESLVAALRAKVGI